MAVNAANSIFDQLGLVGQQPAVQATAKNQLDQDDFLKLMVTEMTHQDPFKPMDNAAVAAQFADVSTVTGIDQLRASLESLMGSMVSDQSLQAASLLGREALVATDRGYLDGSEGATVSGSVNLDQAGANMKVFVTDEYGALIKEIPLGTHAAGKVDFSWDGTDVNGQPVGPGMYRFQVQAEGQGGAWNPEILMAARVESVSGGAGGSLTLNLQGLGPVSYGDIREIRV